ncbi:MAG: radical SAM family heme chaperone HemW [Verrucomicrobiota bacterium]
MNIASTGRGGPPGGGGDGDGDGDEEEGRAGEGAGHIWKGDLAAGGQVGLYVHFPFCGVHCPYCDFAVEARADIPHDAYADAVIAEIEVRAPLFQRRAGEAAGAPPELVSVYFGGGTPGLWRPDAMARVLAAAGAAFAGGGAGGPATREVTVEANPGEMDQAAFAALRALGVNRVSLGLQSLDDRLLRAIGRNHDAAAGPAAVRAARAAGIDNLSVDVMFGLPGQSLDDWRRTVDGVVALRPEHVSAYALTIERGTPFGARARKGELIVPEDEQTAAMQEWGRDALAAAGFTQYEVSSHAQPGRRAVHNTLYWTGAPYLGVGASAASFRPLADGSGWRFSNPRSTATYLRACAAGGGSPAPAQFEQRNRGDLENEAVWLALRTTDGLDRAAHARRFGADPVAPRAAVIDLCVARGWLVVDARAIRPTPAGLLFADEVAGRLWL